MPPSKRPASAARKVVDPLRVDAVGAQRLVLRLGSARALPRRRRDGSCRAGAARRRRALPCGRARARSSARARAPARRRTSRVRRRSAVAPPRSAKPPLRPLAPSATPRWSCTRTRSPASASRSAAEQPVMPAPTIATSTRPVCCTCRRGGASSSSQYGFTRPNLSGRTGQAGRYGVARCCPRGGERGSLLTSKRSRMGSSPCRWRPRSARRWSAASISTMQPTSSGRPCARSDSAARRSGSRTSCPARRLSRASARSLRASAERRSPRFSTAFQLIRKHDRDEGNRIQPSYVAYLRGSKHAFDLATRNHGRVPASRQRQVVASLPASSRASTPRSAASDARRA